MTQQTSRVQPRDWAALAVVCALGCWLLAPSAAWFDSGELAGAAVTLGVPHPTGFPGLLLAGHTAARLPLANAALRVHLLGLVAGAVGLWLAAKALAAALYDAEWPARWLPIASLSLLLLPSVALHLRSTEVYPLVWLLVGAALYAATVEGGRRLAWLGLLSGLAVAVHAEAALLVGALWLGCLPDARQAPKRLLVSVLLGATGALALLALPLAAARGPWLLWEHTDRLEGLVRHLTAAGIREAFRDEMGSAGAAGGIRALWELVWREAGWLLPFAPLGAWAGWPRRKQLWPFLVVLVLGALYAALVNPMGLRDQQTGQVVLVGIGLAAWGGGLALLSRPGLQPRWAGAVATTATTALTLFGVGRLQSVQPAADLMAAPRFLDASWQRVAPGAALVAASDHQAGMCVWQQAAEGVRPDTRCLPGVFLRNATTLADLAEQTGWRGLTAAAIEVQRPTARSADVLAAWLRPTLRERPVLWEPGLAAEDGQVLNHATPNLRWSPLSVEAPPAAAAAAATAALADAATATCAAVGGDATCTDAPQLGGLLASRLGLFAAHLLTAHKDDGNPTQARSLLTTALSLAPHAPKLLHNRAILALADGDAALALRLAEAALDHDPAYLRAHRTAAKAAATQGQVGEAAAHLRAALAGWSAERPLPPWVNAVVDAAPPQQRAALLAAVKPAP